MCDPLNIIKSLLLLSFVSQNIFDGKIACIISFNCCIVLFYIIILFQK